MSTLSPDNLMSTWPALPDEAVTPYLVMDLSRVADAYKAFWECMPDIRIHYAMKCNPHPEILSLLDNLGGRFEIASATELDALVAVGVDPREVLFSNPVKPVDHIKRAAQLGVWRFSCDSSAELVKLAETAPGASVYFRLGMSAFEQSSVASEGKFGVDADTVERLALEARGLGLNPYGLTFHVGSQMLDPNAWRQPLKTCGQIMNRLREHDIKLKMIDVGGGFPAVYDTTVPPLAQYAESITSAVHDYLPYAVDLVAEPGRALVAEGGTIVSTVIGIAERSGRRWVHLDIGAFNGMMESLETQNQLRYPMSDSRNGELISCHVTGPSCDSQDTILFDVPLSSDLRVGDQVIIRAAGAYTTSYASTFNGFDIPNTYAH
jgi:ornithine decarboxylase